jgi:sortase A
MRLHILFKWIALTIVSIGIIFSILIFGTRKSAELIPVVASQAQANSGIPIHLKIPKINVDAQIESVGLINSGEMDIPKDITHAAWFNLGPRPGEKGNAVLDGHFGWKNNIPAVFDSLSQLQKGDNIYVENDERIVTTFVVREVRTYTGTEDASAVFGLGDGGIHLNLITCGGVWDKSDKTYSKRIVVLADKQI